MKVVNKEEACLEQEEVCLGRETQVLNQAQSSNKMNKEKRRTLGR